jgi:FkbM family methyltransferase
MSEISEIDGIKYLIKNKNDLIQKTLSNGVQWNKDVILLIGRIQKKYNLQHCLNIGCHIGTLSIPLSKSFKKITAIEAYPPTFEHLNENLKLNLIQNIETFNFAVGNKNEEIYFLDNNNERIKNNTGGMHVITNDDIENKRLSSEIHSKKIFNQMKKLDNTNIEKFDILIADVEGKEYEMLLGGNDKILKYKPIILIEIWGNKKRQLENMNTNCEKIINHILNLKYKIVSRFDDNYVFFPDGLKVD